MLRPFDHPAPLEMLRGCCGRLTGHGHNTSQHTFTTNWSGLYLLFIVVFKFMVYFYFKFLLKLIYVLNDREIFMSPYCAFQYNFNMQTLLKVNGSVRFWLPSILKQKFTSTCSKLMAASFGCGLVDFDQFWFFIFYFFRVGCRHKYDWRQWNSRCTSACWRWNPVS